MATVNTNPPVDPTFDLLGLTKREICMIRTSLGRTSGNAKGLQALYALFDGIPDTSDYSVGLRISDATSNAPRFDEAV